MPPIIKQRRQDDNAQLVLPAVASAAHPSHSEEFGVPLSVTKTGECRVITPCVHYETVAASQTDQALGATGAIGDYIDMLIVTVATSASGTCSIKDGSGSAIPITAANTPIGVYPVPVRVTSLAGAWSVTTGAGATALAIGRFT